MPDDQATFLELLSGIVALIVGVFVWGVRMFRRDK